MSIAQWILAGYFLAVNLRAFFLFKTDKERAKNGQWRIPEAKLFAAAWIGGGAGAWIAMKVYHHKTRRRSFCFGIPALTFLWAAAGTAVFFLIQRIINI